MQNIGEIQILEGVNELMNLDIGIRSEKRGFTVVTIVFIAVHLTLLYICLRFAMYIPLLAVYM